MAQLVVATSAYTQYPGGIIALRCSDWMAGARGTLSSEVDARSAAGTVVRDSQTVTTSIASNPNGAFQEADDTLEIDLSVLPIEIGLRYILLVSLLIEGDWDPSNTDTVGFGNQEIFADACALRWYGDSTFYLSDSDTESLLYKPRGLTNYRICGFDTNFDMGDVVGNEVLHWRAYAQSGTTVEWLLDQIYFVPAAFFTGTKAGWTADDFEIVPGSAGTFGSYDLSNGEYVDGADGGDANGKFTWHPYAFAEQAGNSGQDGGGDYQKDDSEYFARVVPDDLYWLSDTTKSPGAEEPTTSHCYGIHGPYFIPTQVWTNDPFTRTIGDNDLGTYGDPEDHFVTDGGWGNSPEGFTWTIVGQNGPKDATGDPFVGNHRHGRAAWVNGSEGGLMVKSASTSGSETDTISAGLYEVTSEGAQIVADDIIFSGTCRTEEVEAATVDPVTTGVFVRIRTGLSSVIWNNSYYIEVDVLSATWSLKFTSDGSTLYGPVDISGWYGVGSTFGFRMEVRRYLLRAKLWDASGAEPGAWDYDDFRPLSKAGSEKNYPYQTAGVDDLSWSILESDRQTCVLELRNEEHWACGVIAAYFDDVQVEYDAGGTSDSAWALMEQPEGVEVGRIEMPDCQHLVYWGARDWTTYVPADGPYLEFSSKLWNDPAAAELQRSEGIYWWFRANRTFVIPMNWRSSTREGGWKRILRGYN